MLNFYEAFRIYRVFFFLGLCKHLHTMACWSNLNSSFISHPRQAKQSLLLCSKMASSAAENRQQCFQTFQRKRQGNRNPVPRIKDLSTVSRGCLRASFSARLSPSTKACQIPSKCVRFFLFTKENAFHFVLRHIEERHAIQRMNQVENKKNDQKVNSRD